MSEEREYHKRLLNHNNRFFASQDGKELSVLPESIGLGPREAMPKMMMTDGIGIRIEDITLTLEAGEAVAFQGDMIRIQAPSQVSMVRSGGGAISTFDICNDFNVSGTIGSMKSTSKVAMRIPKSSVVEELGAIDACIAACIAAMPLGCIDAQLPDELYGMWEGFAASTLGAIPTGRSELSPDSLAALRKAITSRL